MIAAEEPVSCDIHGRDHNLLEEPGQNHFKYLAKIDKKLLRLQNQAKLRSYRNSPKHKFGYQIPRNNDYEHDLSIYKHNSNKQWTEAIKIEIDQQHEYDTYKNIGKSPPPKGHKKIRAHFVFYVKHDG